jgi:hypothetical protein
MNDNRFDAGDSSTAATCKPQEVVPKCPNHAGPDLVDPNGVLISLNPDYRFLDGPENAGK